MPARTSLRTLAWCAIALACVACAGVRQARPDPATLAAHAVLHNAQQHAVLDATLDSLAARVAMRGDNTLDILLLSGGGQNGAYGVGFLRGWQARSDSATMPVFDLVTGVSTGTLQAPFALLGTKAALDEATTIYGNAATTLKPQVDWLFWLNGSGGLIEPGALTGMVDSTFDAHMADAVRMAGAEHRRMLFGTSDFDLGVGSVWDLATELARPDGLQRSRSLIVASSAIPGVFPPVIIDGDAHADGGVVANILFPFGVDEFTQLAERVRAQGVHGTVHVRIWAIVNLWTHLGTYTLGVDAGSVRAMQQRTTLLLLLTQQAQQLAALATLAHDVSRRVPGLQVDFRFTSIPAGMVDTPAASQLFDAAWIQRLDTFGYGRAMGPKAWDDAVVSPYLRP